MKQEEFEHTLKQLSGDFNLPVSNEMFDVMMKKRSKQRRKKKLLAWLGGCSVAAALLLASVLYLAPGRVNTGGDNIAIHEKAVVETPSEKSSLSHSNGSKDLENKPEEVHTANKSGSAERVIPLVTNEAAGYEKQLPSAPVFGGKESAAAVVARAGVKHKETTLGSKHSANPVIAVAGSNSNAKESTNPDKAALKSTENASEHKTDVAISGENSSKENSAETVTETPITAKEVEAVPAEELAKATPAPESKSVADSTAPKPDPSIIAAPHKWMIGLYGDYTPVTSAKNSNGAIPLPHTDSLGLSDKANYAFSAGVKFGYSLSDHWKINIGLGFHKVQFDQVRFASEIRVDSTSFEDFSNGLTSVKSARQAYAFNISDRSLSWLQVPLSVSYVATPQKRVSFYAEMGVVYQLLVQNRGYEFTTGNDSLKYDEFRNKGMNRINKNQFALHLEPGIKVHITPHIHYQAGLIYRRHLTSLYKQSYYSNSPAYYLGISSALYFIF